jgi:hypothetical protein
MSFQVLIHIESADPVLGEVEELPTPTDTMIKVENPRMKDGKDLYYLANNVVTVYWPVHRLNFIEVLPSEEEERIIGFVRE